jgi:NAD(P)H-hydrate repair Nnr-like enzyme with NAD(P)H-hydrate epimerase domain
VGIKAEEMGVPPVVSVDIPSGWHVENGDTEGTGFLPEMLVFTSYLTFKQEQNQNLLEFVRVLECSVISMGLFIRSSTL